MDYTPKRVGEKLLIGVDYWRFLKNRTGASIVSAVWTNAVAFGADPNPSAMIDGQAMISGSIVSTWMVDGIADVGYYPKCNAVLSNGEKVTLPDVGDGLLLVKA
jgi:hypothetical protein